MSDILRAKSAPARSLAESAKSNKGDSSKNELEVPPVPTSCEIKYKLYREAAFK